MEAAAADIFVEFPAELAGILAAGGAELVEECRQGEPTKRSLLVLDEEERVERLKGSSLATTSGGDPSSKLLDRCDAEYIKALQVAKECLLSDAVLKQGFCVCADSAGWPDASVIGEAARMRALVLELKGSDDAALRLRSAATLYINECTLPGRYELVPSPLPNGTAVTILETNLGAMGEPTKARVVPDGKASELAASCIYKVNFAPKKWPLSDVFGLRMPKATDVRIAALLQALGVEGIKAFSDLVVRHRRAPAGINGDGSTAMAARTSPRPCGGCVLTPQAFQRRFAMPTPQLAKRCIPNVNNSSSNFQRTRLRSGLFLSAVDLSDVVVVVRNARTAKGFEFVPYEDVMDEQEVAALQAKLRKEKRLEAWRDHMSSGTVSCMRAPERSSMEAAVAWAASHLSVAQDATSSWAPTVVSIASGDVTVVFAKIPANVYCIVFGPRAEETFASDPRVQKDLCDDLAELGELQERASSKRLRDGDDAQGTAADATRLVQAARIVDRSEGLRQLASVVVAMLTQSPLSFEEILSSSMLAPYRPDGASPVWDLKKAVRETLGHHAEYSGRKYHLRV